MSAQSSTVLERYVHPKYRELHLQLRNRSRFLQAVTRIDGRLRQNSTKSSHLPTAFKVAEDWYKRELRASRSFGMFKAAEKLTTDPTMAELFAAYRGTLTPKREAYAKQKWSPIADFWRARTLGSVNATVFREFYTWRRAKNKRVDTIRNHTLHKDVMVVRQILKHAIEQELLDRLPVIPKIGKIEPNPRPWLTELEWRHLWTVSKKRIAEAPNKRTEKQRQDLHDLIVFLYHATCRVGEIVKSLRFRDCHVEMNNDDQKMLIAEVAGKVTVQGCVPFTLVLFTLIRYAPVDETEARETIATRRRTSRRS